MAFIRNHWNGQYLLSISFWLSFVLFGMLYHLLEPVLLNPLDNQPRLYIPATIIFTVLTRLIIFPWQIVGLLRSAEKHNVKYDRRTILYLVQALIVISLIGTISHIIGVAQKLVYYKQKKDFDAVVSEPEYTLSILGNGKYLQLNGTLGFGSARDVGEYIAKHPSVRGIILESDGGQVYEGRGLAMLIQKHKLDTYTFSGCSSSCTTAFISGVKRYLGENATLGFHQYAFAADRLRQTIDVYDLEAEQKKDLALFELRNIDSEFSRRVFTTPSSDMWYPTTTELINAGVIDRVIPRLDFM